MKYVPKKLEGNVNVVQESPVKGFFDLLFRILVVILVSYITLGIAVDLIVPRLSIDTEVKIGELIWSRFEKDTRNPAKEEEKIQVILNKLVTHTALPKFDYKIYIQDSKDVNALALPGGRIIIFTGLLKQVKSENELAMILAHELGHFVSRDHLRALGRGLVFVALSTLTLGADNSISKVISNAVMNVETRFSQSQEQAADIYALDLLNISYNNVAGAIDFYERIAQKEKIAKFLFFFASHPYTKDRISMIKKRIEDKGYLVQEKIPLSLYGEAKEQEAGQEGNFLD